MAPDVTRHPLSQATVHPFLFSVKRIYNKQKLPDPFAYLYKWFGRIPEGVFQVGASNGQEIKGFVTQGIKHGVFIEPLPEPFGQLQKAISAYPGFVAVNALCAQSEGQTCDFHVSGHGGGSSSMLRPTGHLTRHPEVPFGSSIRLQTTTVDRIVSSLRTQGRSALVDSLDLLYIDTQGAELGVLRGSSRFLEQTKYLFVEVSHGGLYEGDANHRVITEFLESRGFRLAFAYFNKAGWGDALYVRQSIFS